jgi:hypothetical protein
VRQVHGMHGHESLLGNDTLASDQIRWRVGMIEVIYFRKAHVGE